MCTAVFPPRVLYLSQDSINAHVVKKHKRTPSCIDGIPKEYVDANGPGWYVDRRDGRGWLFEESFALTDDILAQLRCELLKSEIMHSLGESYSMDDTTAKLLDMALLQLVSLRGLVNSV